MRVHGLNQELAANVVHYREKKGPFHTVEDLIKVSEICFELPNFQLFSIILMKS
jgi:transcriptional accessory protein Tex/SPT6